MKSETRYGPANRPRPKPASIAERARARTGVASAADPKPPADLTPTELRYRSLLVEAIGTLDDLADEEPRPILSRTIRDAADGLRARMLEADGGC